MRAQQGRPAPAKGAAARAPPGGTDVPSPEARKPWRLWNSDPVRRSIGEAAIKGYVVFLLALGAGFGWLGLLGVRGMLERRLVRPLTPGTPSGRRVTVTGTCRPAAEPLLAPVSRRECVWWSWSLQRHSREAAQGERTWHERGGATSTSPFVMENATSRVQVDPRGASVQARTMTMDADALAQLTVGQLSRGPDVVERPSKDTPVARERPIADLEGRWRVVETILPVDSEVWASGTTGELPPPGDGTVLRGVERFPLLISTDGVGGGTRQLSSVAAWGGGIGVISWGAGALTAGGYGHDLWPNTPGVTVVLALVALAPVSLTVIRTWRRLRG